MNIIEGVPFTCVSAKSLSAEIDAWVYHMRQSIRYAFQSLIYLIKMSWNFINSINQNEKQYENS